MISDACAFAVDKVICLMYVNSSRSYISQIRAGDHEFSQSSASGQEGRPPWAPKFPLNSFFFIIFYQDIK